MTDPENAHYAGHYAGQLATYADALEMAGEHVFDRLIYYPITGKVVAIGEPAMEQRSLG